MSRAAIESAIPHRSPMLLLDEIVEQSDSEIVCRKHFRKEEFFFQGHYPSRPVAPGVILCEAAMQSGAVLLASQMSPSDSNGVPVATRLNNVKFKRMIMPGDTVDFHVKLEERLANAYFMSARAYCQGALAMSCEFACTMA